MRREAQLFLIGAGVAAALTLAVPASTTTTGLVEVAGVIRNDGVGWYAIDNATHVPLNVDGVSNDLDSVDIDYTSLNVTKVISFLTGPDETLVKRGIDVGASVGIDKAYLTLSSSRPYADYVSYNGTSWVSAKGVFTLSYNSTTGVLTAAHPEIPSSQVYEVNVTGRGELLACSRGVGTTSMLVSWKDYAGATQTTPSTNMRAFISHGASGPLDPSQVDTVLYPSSNIWFRGIFEVEE
jgi:hypothetical protein